MRFITDQKVKVVFDNYPEGVRQKISLLRETILDVAREIEGLEILEETLKWGEPSYLTKYGSTVRIDWKQKTPDQYAMYFKCTSKLIPTFKSVFKNIFKYEGNRAIVFKMEDDIPEIELRQCITLALTYHKVKKLPKLGI